MHKRSLPSSFQSQQRMIRCSSLQNLSKKSDYSWVRLQGWACRSAEPFKNYNQRWVFLSLRNYHRILCPWASSNTEPRGHSFLMSKQYLQPLRTLEQSTAKRKYLSITSDRLFPPSWYDWQEMSTDMLSPPGISLSDVTVGSCDDSSAQWVITPWPLSWINRGNSEWALQVTGVNDRQGRSYWVIPAIAAACESYKIRALHWYWTLNTSSNT